MSYFGRFFLQFDHFLMLGKIPKINLVMVVDFVFSLIIWPLSDAGELSKITLFMVVEFLRLFFP